MAAMAPAQKEHAETPKAKPSLVELKNGKLNLKQRILAFDKMSETMQEIVQFREMLEQRIESKLPPLDAVPDTYQPLVAKLVHESDKTIVALAKHVQSQLMPVQDEDDEEAVQASAAALPLEVLDRAAKTVADRVDYGLETAIAGARIQAGWHIWRWEVKQEYRGWLPKAAKEKIENRLAERIQAKKDVQNLFDSLPEQQRLAILNVKEATGSVVTKSVPGHSPAKAGNNVSSAGVERSASGPELIKADPSNPSTPAQNGPGRPKKPADPEKAAKEKEKEDKKNARLEKEKKEKAAQAKSRSLMANFFSKTPKAGPSRSTSLTKEPEPAAADPSNVQSDYAKAFRPFLVKKDVEMAPINGFHSRFKGKKFRETRDPSAGTTVIVIDDEEELRIADEDVQMHDASPPSHLERLRQFITSSKRRLPRSAPSGLKSYHPHVVRNILNQLNEAEIAGDDQRVRSLLSMLQDRHVIPAKVLIFHEDARPGYFGTWTRNSREVGPRTPFARDVVARDYTYDSGEEWEEESGDADDVVEDAEDDDAGDEPDSDLDSWLVDDDEVEEPGTPIEERELSPGMPPMLPPLPKRKPVEEGKKPNKRRKVVVPLVPFTKGPCWEDNITGCSYEPFKQYRVQLLNDTPFPIDPFKFVSAPASIPLQERKIVGGTISGLPPETQFAVPALPERLVATKAAEGASSPGTTPPKRVATTSAPKTAFPDAHLPLLVSKIQSMQTGSITGIVENVFQELRAHKVKKNAIEAKVKEIGEKSKERKVWIVKAEFLPSHVP
ncbi:hypothetical protein EIP91_007091 [Steccherinum ochraceum]|uniref:Chromatin assembly factor 1 subunit A dimerization domain-containing protein n=1 Tax=Steccherinum ochraceum TaxID=92696 RepID=A0A4R0RAF5_9APHY|nr:hypothetical protein EIP91_007091 [Steccherinum ochraceum]